MECQGMKGRVKGKFDFFGGGTAPTPSPLIMNIMILIFTS